MDPHILESESTRPENNILACVAEAIMVMASLTVA